MVMLDPALLLEEGIRRELSVRIARQLDKSLVFGQAKSGKIGDESELHVRLRELVGPLEGLRKSLQYIQDYVGLPGTFLCVHDRVRVRARALTKLPCLCI